MGRFEKKKSRRGFLLLPVVAVILLAALGFLTSRLTGGKADFFHPQPGSAMTEPDAIQNNEAPIVSETEAETHTVPAAAPEGQDQTFPWLCAEGKLEIRSLLQYGGINPDCEGLEGTDIGAITVWNVSDTYLEEATIRLQLRDGTQLNFTVTELPAGTGAIAFSRDNRTMEAGAVCTEVACQARFGGEDALTQEQIAVRTEGTLITLENVSGKDYSELVVYCRAPLSQEYFGGMAFVYTLGQLPRGESAEIDAWDCILGEAEVVRITGAEKE